MPNGEEGNQIGYGRTQPEFSLGERMARMEALLAAIDENLKERKAEQKELFGEQIKSVRDDIAVKDKAQKDAVTKAETTATSAATALATEFRQYREGNDGRVGALERGGATGTGEKLGQGELAAREYASQAARTAQKAVNVAIAAIAVPILVAIIFALVKAGGG
jgi:hypothetical protein